MCDYQWQSKMELRIKMLVYIPHKNKYWRRTKFGELANCHAITKFKSCQYFFYSVLLVKMFFIPGSHIKACTSYNHSVSSTCIYTYLKSLHLNLKGVYYNLTNKMSLPATWTHTYKYSQQKGWSFMGLYIVPPDFKRLLYKILKWNHPLMSQLAPNEL